jgi:hypothetical protein
MNLGRSVLRAGHGCSAADGLAGAASRAIARLPLMNVSGAGTVGVRAGDERVSWGAVGPGGAR